MIDEGGEKRRYKLSRCFEVLIDFKTRKRLENKEDVEEKIGQKTKTGILKRRQTWQRDSRKKEAREKKKNKDKVKI